MKTVLHDKFGRKIDYLRLSVTDRCDLRCTYCLPKGFKGFEEPENWLDFDEIERVVGVFAKLGVSRVRLTGGEPLLRRGIIDLVDRLGALPGVEDLSLSTNATQLDKHAEDLIKAGLSRINVSLDSLRADRFAEITGRDCLHDVINGIMAAKHAGLQPIKINMVVLGGVNDDEIDDMVSFCMENGFILRLIENMPVGYTGRKMKFVDLQPIRHSLQKKFGLIDGVVPGGGPARSLLSSNGAFSIGFITPMSQHFCDTCNRLRLGVDGDLHLCLGQNDRFELRSHLRANISDDGLEEMIRKAVDLKPEKHEFKEKPDQIVRFMSLTGG